MIGHIILSAVHRGTIFTASSATYALMDGQLLSRSTYPNLSTYWPTGAYGSTSTTMVLPNLGGSGYYLRGHGYDNNFDPGISTRTTLSGSLPIAPSGIGTIQTASLATHVHASGTQSTATRSQDGGDGQTAYPTAGSTTSATASNASGAVVGPENATVLDLAHMKFYPYIRIA